MTKNENFALALDYLYKSGYISSQKDLFLKTGIAESSISKILGNKTRKVSEETVRRLNASFDNIFNPAFFRGESNVLLIADLKSTNTDKPVISKDSGKPYFNVDFAAGFIEMENDQTTIPDYYIDFPPYNNVDCWCNAHGNSMYPTIASGDIVAMKRIEDFRYLINGEIYAIVTSNGLRTIKRVRDNGETITLIPDNKEVAEQTIPKSIITHIYLIKGAFKTF